MNPATYRTLESTIYSVAALNVFSSALGLLMVEAGLAIAPIKLTATEQGIKSLRDAYGNSIVDRALKAVPGRDLVLLALTVEELVQDDMIKKYGETATSLALKYAPPGDMRTAREIAAMISKKGLTEYSPPEKIDVVVKTGKSTAERKAKAVKDTKTGIIYKSEYAAGKAVGPEFGLSVTDHYAWFKLLKLAPERFKKV